MSARLEKLLLQALVAKPATIAGPAAGEAAAEELAKTLADTARRVLGRALSIREIDAGSCNGCELEIHALNNPVYDLERFGLKFVASPRHADVLLVTGPVTANMKTALERTYHATPAPKWVVATGDCACTGGLFKGSYACVGAVENVIPVDLRIPGCPPRPVEILQGLVALLEAASRSGGAKR
ncbi:MAG TPA: NADH-quinone oxidoreductase subunit B family protein [Xanthobacteraceae bacterium]|nr:NADH-quinone oxidoreductase subunit B family protein [Xanthobacteraceae bacterium]